MSFWLNLTVAFIYGAMSIEQFWKDNPYVGGMFAGYAIAGIFITGQLR